MSSLQGKIAVVTGASSGVGRAAALALASEGVRVTAVARGQEGLRALEAVAPKSLRTVSADASDPLVAQRLLGEPRPDIVVLAAGVQPLMAPLDGQTWESFADAWNTDVKASFHFLQAALTLPLRSGSAVVLVSSGAAISGSHLSGGYAGAKRMQWMLASYAQQLSDARTLGIRFVAVLPKQLIAGTTIAARASAAYGAWLGMTAEDYMKRFEVPLDADKVARAILSVLRGELTAGVTAIGATGTGVESLA